jgi:hypothetical protein
MPVPNGEADGGYEFSVASLSDDFDPPSHRSHLVVTMHLDSDRSPVEAQTLFTRLLAAVVESSDGVAVYWGEAGATHPAQFFLDVANASEDLWIMLWTGISRANDGPGRVSLLSLGMKQFGLLDLMVSAPVGGDPLTFMLDMLTYCIQRGANIPDRDTVGRSANEKLRVRYEPSPINPELNVARIDIP